MKASNITLTAKDIVFIQPDIIQNVVIEAEAPNGMENVIFKPDDNIMIHDNIVLYICGVIIWPDDNILLNIWCYNLVGF